MKTVFKSLCLTAALSGCGVSPAEPPQYQTAYPAPVLNGAEMRKYSDGYLVPHPSGQFVNVSFRTSAPDAAQYRRGASGQGLPFEIGIYTHGGTGKGKDRLVDPAPNLSARMIAGRARPADYVTYAKAVARRTFCNGGRVTENRTAGARISNRADIARVMAANNGNLFAPNARIPDNVKPKKIPVVERRPDVPGYWTVRLRCALWAKP